VAQQLSDGVWLRRADNNERFVAFAFAAADLVVETEADGRITYAAGAFRTRLGQQAEAFVGRPIQDIVDSNDHGILEAALLLVAEKGRLLPLTVRLANASGTQLALAGIRLAAADRPLRLCLTFAVPPTPIEVASSVTPHAFAREAEARLRTGALSDIGLLEISSGKACPPSGGSVGVVLQRVVPNVLASEIAPGRFGLLGANGGAAGLVAIASSLEAALRLQGVDVAVASHHLPLAVEGLTAMQAARALRQALTMFARDGVSGLSATGFAGGLAGYLSRAAVNAAALRQAIRNRRFNLLFQPIVSLADRSFITTRR